MRPIHLNLLPLFFLPTGSFAALYQGQDLFHYCVIELNFKLNLNFKCYFHYTVFKNRLLCKRLIRKICVGWVIAMLHYSYWETELHVRLLIGSSFWMKAATRGVGSVQIPVLFIAVSVFQFPQNQISEQTWRNGASQTYKFLSGYCAAAAHPLSSSKVEIVYMFLFFMLQASQEVSLDLRACRCVLMSWLHWSTGANLLSLVYKSLLTLWPKCKYEKEEEQEFLIAADLSVRAQCSSSFVNVPSWNSINAACE